MHEPIFKVGGWGPWGIQPRACGIPGMRLCRRPLARRGPDRHAGVGGGVLASGLARLRAYRDRKSSRHETGLGLGGGLIPHRLHNSQMARHADSRSRSRLPLRAGSLRSSRHLPSAARTSLVGFPSGAMCAARVAAHRRCLLARCRSALVMALSPFGGRPGRLAGAGVGTATGAGFLGGMDRFVTSRIPAFCGGHQRQPTQPGVVLVPAAA
jgi:hypothetical protein